MKKVTIIIAMMLYSIISIAQEYNYFDTYKEISPSVTIDKTGRIFSVWETPLIFVGYQRAVWTDPAGEYTSFTVNSIAASGGGTLSLFGPVGVDLHAMTNLGKGNGEWFFNLSVAALPMLEFHFTRYSTFRILGGIRAQWNPKKYIKSFTFSGVMGFDFQFSEIWGIRFTYEPALGSMLKSNEYGFGQPRFNTINIGLLFNPDY